jgi:hypothetical protein
MCFSPYILLIQIEQSHFMKPNLIQDSHHVYVHKQHILQNKRVSNIYKHQNQNQTSTLSSIWFSLESNTCIIANL